MLTTDTANDVLNLILAADETEAKSSVRRAQRTSYSGKVRIAMGENAKPVEVSIIDISARGMAFYWPRQISANSRLTARFERPDEGAVIVACTVVHCRPTDDGRFNIGAEFTRIIDRGDDSAKA